MPASVADAFLSPLVRQADPARMSLRLPRMFRKRTLTVTSDDSALRVVAFEGRRIVAWASMDLDGGGPFDLPKAFKPFAGRFSHKIGELPFYSPLTRFMPRPDVRKRYLGPVIAAEAAATLPFETQELDIVWSEVQDGQGPAVMVSATPKREMDAQVDLMGIVGVRPTAAFAKSAALALAAGLPDVAVVNLTDSGADLVLVREEIPRTVHRVQLPQVDLAPDAYAGALAQSIDELNAFEWEENATDATDPPRTPGWVVLTGRVPTAGPVERALHQAFGDRLRRPSPRIAFPDGFPATEYAANVGLALADWAQGERRWHRSEGWSALDLLPERHRLRAIPRRVLHTVAAAAVIAAMVTGSTALSNAASGSVAELEGRLATLEREARVDRVQASRFNRELAQTLIVAAHLEELALLEASRREEAVDLIERLRLTTLDTLVRRVGVVSVDHGDGQLKLTANAPSVELALAFSDGLRASSLFNTVEVQRVAVGATVGPDGGANGATGVTFNVAATYTDPTSRAAEFGTP